jgi:hypothetical protein
MFGHACPPICISPTLTFRASWKPTKMSAKKITIHSWARSCCFQQEGCQIYSHASRLLRNWRCMRHAHYCPIMEEQARRPAAGGFCYTWPSCQLSPSCLFWRAERQMHLSLSISEDNPSTLAVLVPVKSFFREGTTEKHKSRCLWNSFLPNSSMLMLFQESFSSKINQEIRDHMSAIRAGNESNLARLGQVTSRVRLGSLLGESKKLAWLGSLPSRWANKSSHKREIVLQNII